MKTEACLLRNKTGARRVGGGGSAPLEAAPGGSKKYEVKLSKCCFPGDSTFITGSYCTEVLSPESDPLP